MKKLKKITQELSSKKHYYNCDKSTPTFERKSTIQSKKEQGKSLESLSYEENTSIFHKYESTLNRIKLKPVPKQLKIKKFKHLFENRPSNASIRGWTKYPQLDNFE